MNSVELVHLIGNENNFCTIDDLPEEKEDHAAADSKVGPVVCGGSTITMGRTNNCHRLIATNGSWAQFPRMNKARKLFSMTEMNDLLISIGGYGGLSSFEYINVLTGTKWIERKLPFEITHQCATKINQSTIMLIGGYLNWEVRKKFIFSNIHFYCKIKNF